MDGSGGYRVLFRCTPKTTVAVEYDPSKYNRKLHRDESLEGTISLTWNAAQERNPALFNASKFRLAECAASLNEAGEQSVVLRVGLTDYRTFQGTHGGGDPLSLWGRESMSMPLGNATVVETADGQIPLLLRSVHVGEGKGRLTLVGGHAEPSVLQEHGATVVQELYLGAWREVREELFIENVSCELGLLGTVERTEDGKPQMVFVVRINLQGDDLMGNFREKNVEHDENCDLFLLNKEDLRRALIAGQVNGHYLMPEHRGALELAEAYFRANLTPLYRTQVLSLHDEASPEFHLPGSPEST